MLVPATACLFKPILHEKKVGSLSKWNSTLHHGVDAMGMLHVSLCLKHMSIPPILIGYHSQVIGKLV